MSNYPDGFDSSILDTTHIICDKCDKEIVANEYFYNYDGEIYCEECGKEYAVEFCKKYLEVL